MDNSISQRLGIRSNISNDIIDLWKRVQKSALNKDQDNTNETNEEQDHFHLNSLSSRTNALSGKLKLELDDIVLLDETLDGFPLGLLMSNADCKTVCDNIHNCLPLNNLKQIVVEKIINHIIKNKGRMRFDTDKQLLLYVQGKRCIRKSWVVKALELGFAFLDRCKELVISTPTGYAAEGIGGNTVHIALGVNSCRGRNFKAEKNTRWSQCSSLIVDKVSRIDLKLLTIIDKQLRKAKGSDTFSTIFFGGLPLVILMEDSYQFVSMTGKTLWDEAHGKDEIYEKALWNSFFSVLTLVEQMQQKANLVFQELLKQARRGLLNIHNVNILDKKVATNLSDSGSLDTVVVVQKNKTRHLVNRVQIEQFACTNNQTIVIFPTEHYRLKKDGGNLVWHELLFDTQNGERNCTDSGLLLYCKVMPANLLANEYTYLGIVNGVKAIIHGIVPHSDGEFLV